MIFCLQLKSLFFSPKSNYIGRKNGREREIQIEKENEIKRERQKKREKEIEREKRRKREKESLKR